MTVHVTTTGAVIEVPDGGWERLEKQAEASGLTVHEYLSQRVREFIAREYGRAA